MGQEQVKKHSKCRNDEYIERTRKEGPPSHIWCGNQIVFKRSSRNISIIPHQPFCGTHYQNPTIQCYHNFTRVLQPPHTVPPLTRTRRSCEYNDFPIIKIS